MVHSQLLGDGDDPRLWLSSVFLGIFACYSVYNFMKYFVSPHISHYTRLSKTDKVEWNNRCFSTLHAIFISVASTYFLFFSDLFKDGTADDPIVFRSSTLSQFLMGVSIGYFTSDLAMILWFYPALGGKEYVVHHLLSMTSLSLSIFSGQGNYYVYLILLSEITTPFVNLRWYLSVSGLKNTKSNVINGICLFFGWMLARVMLFFYFFFHICHYYNQVKKIFAPGFYCLIMTSPCLAFMNMYWFYKVAKGMLKTLSKTA